MEINCKRDIEVLKVSLKAYFKRQFMNNSIIPPIPLLSDSTVVFLSVRQERFNAGRKQIDVQTHHVRDLQMWNKAMMHHVSTLKQPANMLTNALVEKNINH